MAIRPDYDVGTVTLVASSANFTTSGSALQAAAVQPGDAIIAPSGHILIIASITGQNSGTLFLPCPPAAAGAGLALRIRFQPDGSRYQGAVRNLIDLLSSGNVEAFAALVGASGMVPIFTGVGTMDLADPATFGIQDPKGSLGKLAALTLAAKKILSTNASGNLTQSDITAAALVLLKLAGTAAANKFPYFDDADSAALADLTSQARTMLASTTPAVTSLGYTPVNKAGDIMSGPLVTPQITITSPTPNTYALSSIGKITLNTSAVFILENFSGFIIVNNHNTGGVAGYVAGAGDTAMAFQVGNHNTACIYAAYQNGYAISNIGGISEFAVVAIRTRANA